MGLRAPQELPAGPVFHQNHSPSEGGVLGPASPLRPFPRVHICSACIHTGMCVHTRIDTLWLQCTRCPLCLLSLPQQGTIIAESSTPEQKGSGHGLPRDRYPGTGRQGHPCVPSWTLQQPGRRVAFQLSLHKLRLSPFLSTCAWKDPPGMLPSPSAAQSSVHSSGPALPPPTCARGTKLGRS